MIHLHGMHLGALSQYPDPVHNDINFAFNFIKSLINKYNFQNFFLITFFCFKNVSISASISQIGFFW